jgi:hypothetical protein
VPAQDLINPPAFSELCISPTALNELYPKDRVLTLFKKIGYALPADVADALFTEASVASGSSSSGLCTVNDYRNALNAYLEAVDNGGEEGWLRAHRLSNNSGSRK